MKQNGDNNKYITDKTNLSNDSKIENIKDWRNEHGKPSFKYLQSLAKDGSPGALEKIKSIAQDLDVKYGPNISIDILIRKILATQTDSNTTT